MFGLRSRGIFVADAPQPRANSFNSSGIKLLFYRSFRELNLLDVLAGLRSNAEF